MLPTTVTFQIQTPRTYASLLEQEASLLNVPLPLEAMAAKIGVGPPVTRTVTKTSPTTVTMTISCPLLPIFFQSFPPGSDPLPSLNQLLTGVVETQARLRFVQGSALLA